MKHDMEKIREAFHAIHLRCCSDRLPECPVGEHAQAVRDAIDELEALRAKEAQLDAAIVKWIGEANALGKETGSALTEMRRAFGPGITSAWSMGTFTGPCAHGCDPYTRCDTCGEMEPREAFTATLKDTP